MGPRGRAGPGWAIRGELPASREPTVPRCGTDRAPSARAPGGRVFGVRVPGAATTSRRVPPRGQGPGRGRGGPRKGSLRAAAGSGPAPPRGTEAETARGPRRGRFRRVRPAGLSPPPRPPPPGAGAGPSPPREAGVGSGGGGGPPRDPRAPAGASVNRGAGLAAHSPPPCLRLPLRVLGREGGGSGRGQSCCCGGACSAFLAPGVAAGQFFWALWTLLDPPQDPCPRVALPGGLPRGVLAEGSAGGEGARGGPRPGV